MTADVMDESRELARSGMNDFVVKLVDATERARPQSLVADHELSDSGTRNN
jgi:hypothetical protein